MNTALLAIFLAQAGVFDQGTLVTYLNNQPISREGFKMLEDGRSSSLITMLDPSGPRLAAKTEFYTRRGAMQRAVINPIGIQLLDVQASASQLVYAGGAEVDIQAGGPVYVVENFAWHTLTHIFRAYQPGGEKQFFQMFVPSMRVVTSFELEHIEQSEIRGQTVHRWIGITQGLRQEYASDAQGRLLFARIPAQMVEIVREGWEHLREPDAAGPRPEEIDLQPNRDKYTEREFTLKVSPVVTLAGTITVPNADGPHPAVLLISGSGPQDRDWNLPPALTTSMARQLADRMAAAGFIVVRYDDRGTGSSTGERFGTNLTSLQNDARDLTNYMKLLPDVNPMRIVVAGHSEGAVIAMLLCRSDPTLAGCIIMAGTSRPLDEIMVEQVTAQSLDERLPEATRNQMASMMPTIVQLIESARAGRRGVIGGVGMEWLREHMSIKPTDVIREIRAPILIIQGLDDLQVLSRNARELAEAAEEAGIDVTVRFIPRATHLFTQFPYDNPDFDPEKPNAITPGLFDHLQEWLREKFPR